MYFYTVLILQFLYCFELIESVHTEYGDYKNRIKPELYNPDCGLTTIVDKVKHISGNARTLEMCFQNNINPHNRRSARIINGFVTDIREAPWSTFVYYSRIGGIWTTECGGVILNNRWILTAAHCIEDINGIFGYNGYIYVGSTYEKEGVDYKIENQFKHPKYENCKYDIALTKTKTTIKFTPLNGNYTVNSICLPKNEEKNYREEHAEFYGWGRIENGEKTDILHKMNVILRPFNQCEYNCYCYRNSPPLENKQHVSKES